MNLKSIYTIKFLFVMSISLNTYGQKKKDSLLNIWNNGKIQADERANAYNQAIFKFYVNQKPDSAYAMAKQLEEFTIKNNLPLQRADALGTYGNIHAVFGDYSNATGYYIQALKQFETLEDRKGQAEIYNNLGRVYHLKWNFDKAEEYFKKSLGISRSIKDSLLMSQSLTNIGNVYNNRFKTEQALEYYERSLQLDSLRGDMSGQAITYINMASAYNKLKMDDKTNLYFEKGIAMAKNNNATNTLANAYHMLTAISSLTDNHKKTIDYGKMGLEYAKELDNKHLTKNIYRLLAQTYRNKGQFKDAYYYLEQTNLSKDKLEELNTTQQLQKLEVERIRMRDSIIKAEEALATKKRHEQEIQKESLEKKQLAYGLGAGLLGVSIIGFLVFKNTKRKQLIAEQERELESQEKEKILKDLELSTIDAMIQGQEKERQRLASDLHDSVGATLSAAKLQFEHLIKDEIDSKMKEQLIKKTSTLLEDAYVEIRSMAHLKNSGVMAKNGLLPAVEKLTENASGVNGLSFEVHSHGLEQRLDNTLEISIFRIIQELVTNIIKHADATRGVVHLTNHEDMLNVMVEDNGKGFNPIQVNKTNKGMGINSIDKRIEHLDGKLTIDSKENKGTTVIIDIPI